MKRVKLFLFAAIALVASAAISTAQIMEPVSWKASAKSLGKGEFLVTYTATIDAGWSIYDLGPYEDGPMATTFIPSEDNEGVELIGKLTPKVVAKKKHDAVWGMSVGKYYTKVEFTQKVRLKAKSAEFTMNVEWQACDATSCIAPTDEDLTVTLK